MSAVLQRLRAEVAFDRDAFAARVAELQGMNARGLARDPAQRAQAAVALHHAYGAIESLMTRVARHLEGSLPDGADWHQGLLQSMALDIEGVRPALFGAESIRVLRHLLGFRHFFRHAYAVELEPARLDALRMELIEGAPAVIADLERLDAFLAQTAELDRASNRPT